jgi:ubiquinone/menaquinone biosynthesis C-methylase UbiE
MESDVESWLKEAGEKLLAYIGIEKKQKVLDFGCGGGNYAIPAAKVVGEGGLVYAYDKNEWAAGRLMSKAESMGLENIIRLDASKRPRIALDNECVDVVLLYDVLHHYYYPRAEDRRQLLREVHRVLKASGLLSLYPTHLQSGMEPGLEEVEREIREADFYLESEYPEMLMIHDDNLEKGRVMNFRKAGSRAITPRKAR